MLNSATEILKGIGTGIKEGIHRYYAPLAGNLLGHGIDFANKLNIPPKWYAPYVDKFFNKIHSLNAPFIMDKGPIKPTPYVQSKYPTTPYGSDFKPIIIGPSQNAAFGVGTLGPREPAPAFIGDRQELLENYEIIKTPMNGGKKILVKGKKKNDSIFRNTGKKMPLELMLPGPSKNLKKKPKRIVYKTVI